jgi:hypothetical protein
MPFLTAIKERGVREMEKQQPTSLPWHVDTSQVDKARVFYISTADNDTIATTEGFSPEDEANAHLISAAPELLAALKSIIDAKTDANGETPEISSYLAEAARAAIAKAEA